MGSLDPLKFAVEIEDRTKQQLDDIKSNIESVLRSGVKINVNDIGIDSASITQIMNKVRDALSDASSGLTGNNFSLFADNIGKAASNMETLASASEKFNIQINGNQSMKDFVTTLNQQILDVSKAISQLNNIRNLGSGGNGGGSGSSSSIDTAQKNLDRLKSVANKIEEARRKINQSIEAVAKSGAQYDTTKLRNYIEQLDKYEAKRQQILNDNKLLGDKNGFTNAFTKEFGADFNFHIKQATELRREATKAVKEYEKTQKESARAEKEAAKEAERATQAQQRFAHALSQTSTEGRRQIGVLGELKTMAAQYLGVWGTQQFLNNIIEIGGQLEMQRLSIGAILQSTAQASELFDEIKGMAVKSPFGVVELDQMTKQLTAYGFKYSELFDMTKRLADISAATGTGVDRLALALGHVRSEGALSGYTLRQFSMANIPLLEKLSQKMGKTTEEIRKLVRTKDVSYKDVISVLTDLTDEGGMFYNAQEVMSQSVKAKFKNVKDAMDIMYGDIAESSIGEVLKGVADMLMTMTKNWQTLAAVLVSGAGIWAIQRAAVMIYSKAVGQANYNVLRTIKVFGQQEAANLKLAASYRELTAADRLQIMSMEKLTRTGRMRLATYRNLSDMQRRSITIARQEHIMQQALAVSSGKLRTEDILRQVALGKLTKTEARHILLLSDLNGVERQNALLALKGMKNVGLWGAAFNGLRFGIAKVGAALGALAANPMTWIFAVVSAVTAIWQRNRQEMEAVKELGDSIYGKARDAKAHTANLMQDVGIRYEWRASANDDWTDATAEFGNQKGGSYRLVMPELDKGQMKSAIDEMTQYIRDYAARPNSILKKALYDEGGAALAASERFHNLAEAVRDVAEAQMHLAKMSTVFSDAAAGTNGGWFDNYVSKDIKDYYNQKDKYRQKLQKAFSDYERQIEAALSSAMEADGNFAEKTAGMNTVQRYQYLLENSATFKSAYNTFGSSLSDEAFKAAVGDVVLRLNKVAKAEAEMNKELDEFDRNLVIGLAMIGKTPEDVAKDTALQEAILTAYRTMLKENGLTDEEVLERMSDFAARWNIEMDINGLPPEDEIDEITKRLRALTGTEWKIDIEAVTNTDTVIDDIRNEYKAAKDYFEKVEPILVKYGIEFKLGDEDINEGLIQSILGGIADEETRNTINDVIRGALELNKLYKGAQNAANTIGFALEDDKKGKEQSYKADREKRWDERIRVMKEAYDWYDKWEKKVGADDAFERVQARYGDMFKEWEQYGFNFEAGNVTDYLSYVEKIRDEAFALYQAQKNDESRNNGQEALRVYRQAVAVLEDAKFDNFTRAAEEFKSVIDKTLENINDRWKLYESVLSATNDMDLAYSVAGIKGGEMLARNSADALRRELSETMRKYGFGSVPIDILIDEESLRKQLEDAVPEGDQAGEYSQKIDGIIRMYQEWQKLQREVVKSDAESFASLIGSAKTYEKQIADINSRLREQMEANARLRANGNITNEQRKYANQLAVTQADYDKMQLSAKYANVFNHALGMTRQSFEDAAASIERMLAVMKEFGLLSPQDYVSAMKQLTDARMSRTEGYTTKFGAFMSGGEKGLASLYYERELAALEKMARSEAGSAEYNATKKDYEKNRKLYESAIEAAAALDKMSDTIGKLSSAMGFMGDFFNSIGQEDLGEAFGSNGVLGQTFSGVTTGASVGGVWGAVIGGAMGLVSGAMNSAERARQERIEQNNRVIKKMENIAKNIQDIRESALGYAKADKYSLDTFKADLQRYRETVEYNETAMQRRDPRARRPKDLEYSPETVAAMEKAISSESAYAAEYASMLARRDEIQRNLSEEERGSNADEDKIEEYRQQLQEIESEISNFTEEIAKDLWGIDIKGWASQISDALVTAFENGENAAKAYEDAVRSIMQSVAGEIIKVGIIEPIMEDLKDKLFGKADDNGNRTGGLINVDDYLNNPADAAVKTAEFIAEWFNSEGKNFLDAAQMTWNGINEATGGMLTNPSSNTLSASMQGTTEETSDLLAGYVNALRQDTAVQRMMQEAFINEMWPDYMEQFASQCVTVQNIDANVRLIARMMQAGSGAMYDEIAGIGARFRNVTDGTDRIHVQ